MSQSYELSLIVSAVKSFRDLANEHCKRSWCDPQVILLVSDEEERDREAAGKIRDYVLFMCKYRFRWDESSGRVDKM